MGAYFRSYSDFVQRIDQDALVDSTFRDELLSGKSDIIKEAIKQKYSLPDDSPLEMITINVHEDTETVLNIVLSPRSDKDGAW